MLLDIQNLHCEVAGNPVLQGIDLQIKPGEVHAIMGPNGSGKSTLGKVIAGHPSYQITQGRILYQDHDLADVDADARSRSGIFLAFQDPVEIPGVNNTYFLKAALNAQRKARGLEELDAFDFLQLVKAKVRDLKIDPRFLDRPVNQGFSGGEKKRNELLQMAVLEPHLAVLDEIDSGLDIDGMRLVAEGVNRLRHPDRAMLLVTHYQRLLDYIVPDYIHVLAHGRIVRSGDKSLATELETHGYGWIDTDNTARKVG